jgi:hypothetical protein
MRIHLITVVGGNVDVLPFFIQHYRQLRIESFLLNVHLCAADDPIRDAVRQVSDEFACPIASETVGSWQPVLQESLARSRSLHPDDWHVLVDQDELQVYRDELPSLLAWCDRRGYDYVTGAFVDRLAADGFLPAVHRAVPIWDQFPLGAFLTHPLIGGDPRKVVAAKGRVRVSLGQHIAFDAVPCPIEEQFVQVHHFKWTAGLLERLRLRARQLREAGVSHYIESEKFVSYIEAHDGRIDLSDDRFLVAACRPDYPHWPKLVEMAIALRAARAANA